MLGRRRQGPEQLKRPTELLLGLLVGQLGHGMVSGGEHVGQRCVGPRDRDRRPLVLGELEGVLGMVGAVAAN